MTSPAAPPAPASVRYRWLVAAFVSGAGVMMLEIVGARLLAPAFGYSIYQWGALIGVVLSALTLGYAFGGRVGDGPNAEKYACGGLFLAGALSALLPVVAPTVLLNARQVGPVFGAILASVVLLAPPAFLLAIVNPIVVRLTTGQAVAGGVGFAGSVSTVGSIVGTFFAAFFAIPELGSRATCWCVAVGLFGTALLVLPGKLRARIAASLAGVGWIAALSLLPVEKNFLYESESVHNHIIVQDIGTRRFMYLNQTTTAASVLNLVASPSTLGLLTRSYRDLFLIGPHLSGGHSLLLLGVGGGTSLGQLAASYPGISLTGVELDPQVLQAGREYFGLGQVPGLSLHAEDARWFLTQHSQRYDVVGIDLFVTGQIPAHLVTSEFLALVRNALNPNGVLLLNVLARRPHADALVGPIVRTVKTAFPSVFDISEGANHLLLATCTPTSSDELSDMLAVPSTDPAVQEVLGIAAARLRSTPAGDWPIFTDDKSDIDMRASLNGPMRSGVGPEQGWHP